MGIKGIKSLIKKHAPEAITEISLSYLRGKTVCIDSSILLYKFRYTYATDNFHILGFLHKIIEFLENDIKVIFVFDGKPPEAKREVLNKRKEKQNKYKEELSFLLEQKKLYQILDPDAFIDSDSESAEPELNELHECLTRIKKVEKNVKTVERRHSLEVMEMLKSIGIAFFVAKNEAEELCTHLQLQGYADYILTEDTDCLTFGGKFVLFTHKAVYFLCSLEKVLSGLQLNQDEFIDLCILCGCDYTTTIPKVGPVTALNIIKKFRSIDIFLSGTVSFTIPETFDYRLARSLFKRNDVFVEMEIFKKNKKDFIEILSKNGVDEKLQRLFIKKMNFCDFLI